MNGTIELQDLRVRCIIGIHPHERVDAQDLFFDARVTVDFAAAEASEDVGATVDYTAIAAGLERLACEGRFQLVETLAERSAAYLLATYPTVLAVAVTVKKPAAVPQARNTLVRVERVR